MTGLLGGTFDPIHLGHLRFAESAVKALSLNKLLFIPNAGNPLKTDAPETPAADRLEMVRLAVKESGNPALAVSDFEALRPPPSFMVDTIEALEKNYRSLALLMGSEVFASLPQWKEPETIIRKVMFVLVTRKGQSRPAVGKLPFQPRIQWLEMDPLPYSATSIREKLHALSASEWAAKVCPVPGLSPAVWGYIQSHNLYRK